MYFLFAYMYDMSLYLREDQERLIWETQYVTDYEPDSLLIDNNSSKS